MKKNKLILLIGDSQPLPRYVGDNFLNYFETFNYKLKKKFKNIDFLEVVIGGAKLSDLLAQVAPYYGKSKPDLVIIFGTNQDARIRGISFLEEKIINLFPYGFLLSKSLKNNSFLQNLRKINVTKVKNFLKQLNFFFNIFKNSKIIWIEMYASNKFNETNKLVYKNMSILNKITLQNLKKKDTFVKIQDRLIKDKCFNKDMLHINKKGHDLIYKILKNIIIKSIK